MLLKQCLSRCEHSISISYYNNDCPQFSENSGYLILTSKAGVVLMHMNHGESCPPLSHSLDYSSFRECAFASVGNMPVFPMEFRQSLLCLPL